MGKPKFYGHSNVNKLLEIEKLKRLELKIDSVMPNVYASVAIALVTEYGWDKQQVADLFAFTGALWKKCSEKGITMCDWCTDICDIDVTGMANHKTSPLKAKYDGGVEVYG